VHIDDPLQWGIGGAIAFYVIKECFSMMRSNKKTEFQDQQRVEHKEMIDNLRASTQTLHTMNETSKLSFYMAQKIKEDTTKIKVKVGLGGDD